MKKLVLKKIISTFKGVFNYNILSHFRPLLPRELFINVTYRCNSRCLMCNIWKYEKREEMSLSQFDEVLSDRIFKGVEQLVLSGGEPFFREDFVNLVGLFIEKMPKLQSIAITTNGLMTNRILKDVQKIAEFCQEKNINLNISVSLDGLVDINDKLRGVPGAFDKTVETINQFKVVQKNAKFHLGVACVICKLNLDNINALRDWCKQMNLSLGFMLIGFHESYVNNLEKREELDFNEQNKSILFPLLEELAQVKTLTNFNAFYWNDMLHMLRDGKKRQTPCPMVYDSFVLDAYGDIYYCLSEKKIGNCLNDGSCSQIYYHLKNLRYRKEIKKNCCPKCNSICNSEVGIRKSLFKYLFFYLKGSTGEL